MLQNDEQQPDIDGRSRHVGRGGLRTDQRESTTF